MHLYFTCTLDMFPLVHLRLSSHTSRFPIAVFYTGCFARGRLCRQIHLSSRRFSAVTGTSTFDMSSGSRTSKKEGQTPSIPRPSSSLIVINDKNEVLMVQRNPDSRSFAGAHVRTYINLILPYSCSSVFVSIGISWRKL